MPPPAPLHPPPPRCKLRRFLVSWPAVSSPPTTPSGRECSPGNYNSRVFIQQHPWKSVRSPSACHCVCASVRIPTLSLCQDWTGVAQHHSVIQRSWEGFGHRMRWERGWEKAFFCCCRRGPAATFQALKSTFQERQLCNQFDYGGI